MAFLGIKTFSHFFKKYPISVPTLSFPSPLKIKSFINFVWPIKANEMVKFALITLVMFGILGIQNLIRALKDGLVNTMIGTETISFLKVWGVMPASIMVTLLYIKLTSSLKGEHIFYLIISLFLSFFLVFAFFIFPNYEYLHLSKDKVENYIRLYPHAKWFILILSNWSVSLFYIIAELWPNAVYALLFWQFVNKITPVEQSTRFYPLFGMFSQTGLVLSGVFLTNLPQINNYILTTLNISLSNNELTIKTILTVVIILGLISLSSFWYLNAKILDKEKICEIEFTVRKNPLSLMQSIRLVARSKYILLISLLLICYGVTINLVEGPWKSMVSKVYTNPTDFTVFVGKYLTYTGFFTIFFAIIGSNIIRRFGWIAAALITPSIIIVTGCLFFISATSAKFNMLLNVYGIVRDPMLVAIIIGVIQNVLSKSSKYAIFDSTKEMTYVPLSYDLKTNGKAAADVISTKLGKSASAFIQSLIFIIFPSANFISISRFLMFLFIGICIIWVCVIIELNKEYQKAVRLNKV